MKIFLDTPDINEIRTAVRWGVLDGVTTHPSLYAKVGGKYDDILKEICSITSGPVSAEVVASDVEGMLAEGRHFAMLAPNIIVKVPMSEEGLESISCFAAEGIKTNCTLVFSANQGLLAAKAGASLVSPFVGRLDGINEDGITVVRELAGLFSTYDISAEIIAASIRTLLHVTQAAMAGAHIARCRSRCFANWSSTRSPTTAPSSSARTGTRPARRRLLRRVDRGPTVRGTSADSLFCGASRRRRAAGAVAGRPPPAAAVLPGTGQRAIIAGGRGRRPGRIG